MRWKKRPPTEEIRPNPGYAVFQISKALLTLEEHDDPETRERARKKVEKWKTVLEGLISGRLQVGSRTPAPEFPVWVTLEVMMGGFATGRPLAGGPLLDHERELLRRLRLLEGADARRALNSYYLTDDGLVELEGMLESQQYSMRVPEEGALLAIALLVRKGQAETARKVLEGTTPLFSQLRFYPAPRGRPRLGEGKVLLQDVAATVANLKMMRPNPRILAQKEAVEVWAPLCDEAAALVLETIGPIVPRFLEGFRPEDRNPGGVRFVQDIGFPWTEYPKGSLARAQWRERAQVFLDRYDKARRVHRLCGKPDRQGQNFREFRRFIDRALHGNLGLEGDRGGILVLMAQYLAKHGLPNSPECSILRKRAAEQVAGPTFHTLARVTVERLARHSPDGGLEDVDELTGPLTEAEIARLRTGGAEIPVHIKRKVARSLIATPEVLVERGVITSSETLARVLPQATAGILSQGYPDASTRWLHETTYQAFRRRRSLLLFNLESQVRFEELPWVKALEPLRSPDVASRGLAIASLRKAVLLAITSFPQAILPNKLLQEFRALSHDAHLNLLLTEEVAADIFMGKFGPKFTQAAKRAANLLRKTTYERYYGIDYSRVEELPEPREGRQLVSWGRGDPDPLTKLCVSRAKLKPGDSFVVANGMVIEQQQIITTHNLAALFSELDLVTPLRATLPQLARRCFRWICKRAQVKGSNPHASLIMLKEAAYAWRQMVFYLALVSTEEQRQFLGWAFEHLAEQSDDFKARFSQALKGLSLAIDGHVLDDSLQAECSVQPLLGWTNGQHWLLGKTTARP